MSLLMPLIVPAGWAVLQNCFEESEMTVRNGVIVNHWVYQEDLLSMVQVVYEKTGYRIEEEGYWLDLGWYPEADPQGQYRVVLFRDYWNNQLVCFESKNRKEVQRAVNQLLLLFGNTTVAKERSQAAVFYEMMQ